MQVFFFRFDHQNGGGDGSTNATTPAANETGQSREGASRRTCTEERLAHRRVRRGLALRQCSAGTTKERDEGVKSWEWR